MDGRTITVGGEPRTCGQMPLTRSPDGYTYFSVTGRARGDHEVAPEPSVETRRPTGMSP